MILLIGDQGSMGKRYTAILNHIGADFIGIDKETQTDDALLLAKKASKIIIAIPTDLHHFFLKKIIPMGKSILCEKPITKNMKEMASICRGLEESDSELTMMFQYTELVTKGKTGPSTYDYFRTGNDGLIWDCLQIIALATEGFEIDCKSPIWKCTINGEKLQLSDMDHAYIKFVRKWSGDKIQQKSEELFLIHEKVGRINSDNNAKFN